MTTTTSRISRASLPFASKVPEVAIAFWIIKVLATTVGETAADFLSDTLGFGLTVTSAAMAIALALVLVVQFRARRYIPSIYWLAVVFVSIVGTLFSDNLVDNVGVPLWLSTWIFAVLLVATYAWWFSSEQTLSIHSIVSPEREGFYWAAVLFAFALGTSAGDLVAEGLDLGYLLSLCLFAAAILLVLVLYGFFKLNAVVSFWIAYVLTRPLGASGGDLLSQPVKDGGLGFGTTATSAVFLVAILALVIALTIMQKRRRTAPLVVAPE